MSEYECFPVPYAAANRAGLFEWETGLPISAHLAIVLLLWLLVQIYNFPALQNANCTVNEELYGKCGNLRENVVQGAAHRIELYVPGNCRGRGKKIVDKLPKVGYLDYWK